ncbi:MAG: polysaccharide biosynthesis tyrosine autokinase [Chloroflexota bacterium]|nr:MAG: polysaccharide biosynthesis tyrosine autokinase [Chloroflexota bacterium]
MELNQFLQILWRRKWIILLTTLATLAIVIAGRSYTPDTYTTSSTVRFLTARGGSPENVRYEVPYADRLMNTYRRIANSETMLQKLQDQLGRDDLPDISVGVIPNTELMRITTTGPDPILARDTANKLADLLIAQSLEDTMSNYLGEGEELPAAGLALQRPTITLLERAETPLTPSGLSLPMYALLGLIGGVLAGSGLAFLLQNLDNRLYSQEKVQALSSLPVLGEISVFKDRKKKLFLDGEIQAEEFRRLRTVLLFNTRPAFKKTILVTSGDAKEGKSVIVANLALSVARMGLKVLVIDVDMRRPAQHQIFHLPGNDLGLSNVLTRQKTPEEVIQNSQFPGVDVLPSGPYLVNPADLIDTSEMVALLDQLKQQYDLILIDTPAFLHVPDVVGLASLVDGVVVIVRSSHTQEETLQALLQQLTHQKAFLMGVVMNGSNRGGRLHLRNGYYMGSFTIEPLNGKDQPSKSADPAKTFLKDGQSTEEQPNKMAGD